MVLYLQSRPPYSAYSASSVLYLVLFGDYRSIRLGLVPATRAHGCQPGGVFDSTSVRPARLCSAHSRRIVHCWVGRIAALDQTIPVEESFKHSSTIFGNASPAIENKRESVTDLNTAFLTCFDYSDVDGELCKIMTVTVIYSRPAATQDKAFDARLVMSAPVTRTALCMPPASIQLATSRAVARAICFAPGAWSAAATWAVRSAPGAWRAVSVWMFGWVCLGRNRGRGDHPARRISRSTGGSSLSWGAALIFIPSTTPTVQCIQCQLGTVTGFVRRLSLYTVGIGTCNPCSWVSTWRESPTAPVRDRRATAAPTA
eukprot:gene12758-biopygen4964